MFNGTVSGNLSRAPQQVADSIVILHLISTEPRYDSERGKQVTQEVPVKCYGANARNALQHLVKGQFVEISVGLETRRKDDGKVYRDFVARHIIFGTRPRRKDGVTVESEVNDENQE